MFDQYGLRVHFTESGWTGLLFLYKIKHDRRSFGVVPSRMVFFKMMNGIFQNERPGKISEHRVNLPYAGSTGMLIMSTTK